VNRKLFMRALFGRRARRKWCWALVVGFVAGAIFVSTCYPPWSRHSVARGDSSLQAPQGVPLAETATYRLDAGNNVPEPGTALVGGLMLATALLRRPSRQP
jgi:hypothetical protein